MKNNEIQDRGQSPSKGTVPRIALILLGGLTAAVAIAYIMNFFAAPIGIGMALAIGITVAAVPIIVFKPETGLFLIGFFLPFERIPTIELGGATVRINYLLILLLLVVYILTQLAQKKLKIPKDPIRFFILLFLLLTFFSLPRSVNMTRSIEVFSFLILMGIAYLTITLVAQEGKKAVLLAVRGLLWGALVAAVFGLYQFFGDMVGLPISATLLKFGYDKTTFGFARIQAFSQEPLYFSNYLFIPFFVALILTIRGKISEVMNKNLAIVLICLIAIELILAISRGAYLGFMAGLVAFVIVEAKTIFKAKVIIPLVIAGTTILIGSYIALARSEPRAVDEFTSHLLVQDREVAESVVARVSASKQAIELFKENPYLGVGIGNFGPRTQGDPQEVPEGGWVIVNNEYLEILAEIGVVGLLGFTLLIGAIFIRAIIAIKKSADSKLKAVLVGFTIAFFAILVQYATFSTLYIFHVWFLIGMIGGVSNLILSIRNSKS